MNAGFGWIDFSDEQREYVHAVIDMMSASGTVDEIGVGSARDSIADWLFPGISTIQTRPKYFIIITEILLNYIQLYIKNKKLIPLEKYLTQEENRIMYVLAGNYPNKDKTGVIGINVARNNGELVRKASFIYWNGLRLHGFINTHLSRSEYVKAFDLSENLNDGDEQEINENFEYNFGIKAHQLETIHEDMTMELTRQQAKFLRDQFLDTSHPDKQNHNLLSEILKNQKLEEIILNADNFRKAAEAILESSILPDETRAIIRLALDFDLLLHGAHIRYNIQLHRKSGSKDYNDLWIEWLNDIEDSKRNIESFSFNILFSEVAKRVDPRTQVFMKTWQEEVLKVPIDIQRLDDLVYRQEINKKGAKAKLALKDGEYDSWVGLNGLEYRFSIVKNLINDLQVSYA